MSRSTSRSRRPARNKRLETCRLQGSTVRVLREQLGMTQGAFGKKFSLTQRQISFIETGSQRIPEKATTLRDKIKNQFELTL